jgi:two-component system nitrate/nitrite response regulator NarL
MAKPRAVVVADIDVLVTDAIADLLERHGYSVRIAPPVHAAVRDWVRSFDAGLCVIDLALRDGEDPANIQRLVADLPSTKVIIRTANSSSETMQAALIAGASGYLHKSRGPGILLEMLTRVADGEVVVEGSFARTAARTVERAADVRRMIDSLTPRQRQCLELITRGQGTLAIAEQMGVSSMTVRSHVQGVLGKLGVGSRLEAASLANQYRLDPAGHSSAAPAPLPRAR